MRTSLITCILVCCILSVAFCEEPKKSVTSYEEPKKSVTSYEEPKKSVTFCEELKKTEGPQTLISKELIEVAKSITIITDDFTKTSIGTVAYYALAWKLLVKPVLSILLGIPIWILLNYLLWIQTEKFFGTERVEIGTGEYKDIKYVRKFDFKGDGATGAGLVLGCLAVIINIAGFIVVF